MQSRRGVSGVRRRKPQAAFLGHPEVLVNYHVRRGASQAQDDERLYDIQLLLQPGQACVDLRRLGGSVSHAAAFADARAAFQHVADVNMLSCNPVLTQRLVEKLSRPADERSPCGIFVRPRTFADDYQRRDRVPFAEHDVRPGLPQLACLAVHRFGFQFFYALFDVRHISLLRALRSCFSVYHRSPAGPPAIPLCPLSRA